MIYNDTYRHGTHVLEKGTELTVDGVGRVKFVAYVANPDTGADWVDVMNQYGCRSVRPERIRTVHRNRRLP